MTYPVYCIRDAVLDGAQPATGGVDGLYLLRP